jgi:peptidoglycan/xylan/chitin deacetylase (PgdA/CDA1 family)
MQKLYIAMYHYTRDLKHSRYPEIKGMDSSLFRKQIEFIKESFHVMTMEQVIEAVKGGAELPENAMLLTFDDGYADNYTVAFPILEEYGLQGSFLFQERHLQHISCLMSIKYTIYWQVQMFINLLKI